MTFFELTGTIIKAAIIGAVLIAFADNMDNPIAWAVLAVVILVFAAGASDTSEEFQNGGR